MVKDIASNYASPVAESLKEILQHVLNKILPFHLIIDHAVVSKIVEAYHLERSQEMYSMKDIDGMVMQNRELHLQQIKL